MIDLDTLRLFQCWDDPSLRKWARKFLPKNPPPPFGSPGRKRMLSTLSDKWSRVQVLLAQLNELIEDVVKDAAILSPARLVPVEILSSCFEQNQIGESLMVGPPPPQTIFSDVCRLWRDTIATSPHCWNTITLDIWNDGSREDFFFSRWDRQLLEHKLSLQLQYSQTAHLDLTYMSSEDVICDRDREFRQLIGPNLARCRSYNECSANSPSLLEASINHSSISFLPKLEHLHYSNYNHPSGQIRASFPKLQELHVTFNSTGGVLMPDSPTVHKLTLDSVSLLVSTRLILEFLQQYSCITSLGIPGVLHLSTPLSGLFPNVTVLRLGDPATEGFGRRSPNTSKIAFDGYHIFPMLSTLVLQSMYMVRFLPFPKRGGQNITTLRISSLELSYVCRLCVPVMQVSAFLGALPNLTRVEVVATDLHADFDCDFWGRLTGLNPYRLAQNVTPILEALNLQDAESKHLLLCPDLNRLTLEGQRMNVGTLIRFMEARMNTDLKISWDGCYHEPRDIHSDPTLPDNNTLRIPPIAHLPCREALQVLLDSTEYQALLVAG